MTRGGISDIRYLCISHYFLYLDNTYGKALYSVSYPSAIRLLCYRPISIFSSHKRPANLVATITIKTADCILGLMLVYMAEFPPAATHA